MDRQNTQVIVVGGSLVGLSASLFLASRKVNHIVVEKHKASSPHPRAMGFTEHTLEFFRAVGLAERIPQTDPTVRLQRMKIKSLAGQWGEETHWTPGASVEQRGHFSPCSGAAIPQDKLEPILGARASELGADLRLGTEILGFSQGAEEVEVAVRERDTGKEYIIAAPYLIAADGADSAIREQLGITRQGIGHVQTIRSVLFRCPEADAFLERGVQQFEIEQPGFKAFLTSYHDGRWVLMFSDDAERSHSELEMSIRQALGQDMKFQIITTGRWELAGRIAERYRAGRVFLAGDSAHQLPPTRGGFGANTGIDDVYNLAWKLELVLKGASAASLLDTYNDERQPIGWLRHQQTFARPDYSQITGKPLEGVTLYGEAAMELGQLQRSSAIIGAGPDLPRAQSPDKWAGQPGVRAPHAWITYQGQTISTIDLFTRGFLLLTRDARWQEYVRGAQRKLAPHLRVVLVGVDIHFEGEGVFERLFGVDALGATLVRPDGVVCWRTRGEVEHPGDVLCSVLTQVASALDKPQAEQSSVA